MNQKATIATIIAISLIFLAILPATLGLSNELFEVKNATNVNGSIGLNIYNKLDRLVYADDSHHDYVFTFYLTANGTEIPILTELSDTRITSHDTGLVVIDTPWPTSNYKKVKIDLNGETEVYFSDTYYVFSKPGFKVQDTSISPLVPIVTEQFTFIIDVEATGDADITNIAVDADDPYLFRTGEVDAPTSLAAGEEAQIRISYNPNMDTGFGTISYKEIEANVTITYKYHDMSASTSLGEKIYVYDPDEVGDKPSEMEAKIEMDSASLARGSSSDLEVYLWNSNKPGGHSACNVSTTLTPSDASITVSPSPTILLSSKSFPSGSSQPSSSTATYTVNIGDNTKAGTHTLELTVDYEDCAWPITGSTTEAINITVEGGTKVVPPAEEDEEAELEQNASTGEKVIEMIEEPTKSEGVPLSYIAIAAVVGVFAAIFGGYFFLKATGKIM